MLRSLRVGGRSSKQKPKHARRLFVSVDEAANRSRDSEVAAVFYAWQGVVAEAASKLRGYLTVLSPEGRAHACAIFMFLLAWRWPVSSSRMDLASKAWMLSSQASSTWPR